MTKGKIIGHFVAVNRFGQRVFTQHDMDLLMSLATQAAAAIENLRLFEAMQQAMEKAEAANKELEAFAYSVSHDLRAPLRHIDGFMELLQKRTVGALDERAQHYMDTISDSAKRMGQLIDDLLAFSRMGRYEMSKMPVDLNELVQEIIQELAPEIQDRTIRWRITSLPTISGDRAMLRLVLVNLIANALKFTRPRPQADIEIGCLPDQGAEIIVFVRDNGVGFDMAYADKLFGVFQRLHRADEFEGTGIGLATVRRIITRHGGRTWAEGQVNQGATFYFSLSQLIQET
jgi:light-regulated signal transduction histidine kinase (bacteriophytochrome)